MTEREKMQAWVKSLKPGDKVVYYRWLNPEKILTVKKVTPSGIVRTDDGSYKQYSYGSCISGIGTSPGHIEPITEENAREAVAEMERVAEARNMEHTIRKAKDVCYELRYGYRDMTYELAQKILEIAADKNVGHTEEQV